ncbi:MAG: hypothetical protein E7080_04620 [Bacteroidales bacterium]|nr:hypothetical protein [Bacteroidales bacterium]
MKGLKIYLIVILVSLLSACTRNDGDIGELFGMWRVVAIEVNDVELNDYSGTLYFEFQSGVYCQKLVNESLHICDDQYASWYYQSKDEVVVDFSDNRYAPISITGMQSGKNLLVIENCSGSDMKLLYNDPNEVKYTYILKKW